MSALPSDAHFPLPDEPPLQLVEGQAPSLLWYLTEPTRAAVDIGQFASTRQLLRAAPSGDGHPVLVLPGLGATDTTTATLRRFLSRLGYDVHGWGLGRNIGPTIPAVQGIRALLRELGETDKVSLIGWSLGGIFAREIAREHPELVRQVITMGSPYAMTDMKHTRANPVYQLLARFYKAGASQPPPEHTRPPFPVPATSIYSRSDGIVPWQGCRSAEGPRAENVAVSCSHLGFAYNPSVMWVIADRLSQPYGYWHPFAPPPGMANMYPKAA
ncbi:esterase/lipase family protein [Umezawaea tangerina]|uniref:Alpha/beta hydrolase family protein n=1 Tax=Umezawaea tangerina TaxID=84725 RepID=A0A2T0T4T8_9PSEU|nr:alpha/beta hydrolase [Umezawaea tangerina]PRY40695.1 alpha/beta hydrolase family protein [Umezawaea tangerina]